MRVAYDQGCVHLLVFEVDLGVDDHLAEAATAGQEEQFRDDGADDGEVAAMRRPANSDGAADGKQALTRMVRQLAPCSRGEEVDDACDFGGHSCRPSSRVMGMANSVNLATIRILGRVRSRGLSGSAK